MFTCIDCMQKSLYSIHIDGISAVFIIKFKKNLYRNKKKTCSYGVSEIITYFKNLVFLRFEFIQIVENSMI